MTVSSGTEVVNINPNDVQHMIQLLHGLIQPNTETIRAAEQALKPILKQPVSMDLLWTIITSTSSTNSSSSSHMDDSQYTAIRHVATIVLRKRLPAHYASTFRHQNRDSMEWPTKILQTLAVETVRPVRMGLLGVAAVLAAQQQQQDDGDVTDNNTTSSSSSSLRLRFVRC